MTESTPLFNEEERAAGYGEAPPSYDAVMKEQTQPVVPSAPPASERPPYQVDPPYPPQPVSVDPNSRTNTTTTTTTTYVTTTETRTRERSCCPDTYCPGFIFCFYVPTPCPANCDCNCDCLPPTTSCCGGGCQPGNCGDCGNGDNDNPVVIIIVLIILALILVALIGIIAFLIYRLGDDKPPAIAKRYRIFAVVFAVVAYTIVVAAGIALAIVYAD